MPFDPSQLKELVNPQVSQQGVAYLGGSPNFNEATGQYRQPQPAFTPISQALQGQGPMATWQMGMNQQPQPTPRPTMPTQPQMPGPPQGFPTQPRPMPPMAQGQGMPNLAQMLAQLGGKFPLMQPGTLLQNQRPIPSPQMLNTPTPRPAQTQPGRMIPDIPNQPTTTQPTAAPRPTWNPWGQR